MKREIKFRGYDTVNEKMLPVEVIDFYKGFISLNEGDNSLSDTWDMIALMQFVKHENGFDFYEGDICTGYYPASSDDQYTNVIEWNDGESCWYFANAPLWVWENLTPIGNVCENPDLLTPKTPSNER